MADLKLVGAVAIKVRPDATGFKRELQGQVDRELKGYDVTVKVKADPKEAKETAEQAKKAIEAKSITLRVDYDYDLIRRAQQQLAAAVKNLNVESIKVTLDPEGIEEARQFLEEIKDESDVHMTLIPDEKGFKDVLAKIAAIRRDNLIEIPLSFPNTEEELAKLEAGMNAALFEASKINLTYTNDRASLERAIATIAAEQDNIDPFELPVFLNAEDLAIAREQLEAELAGIPVLLKVNYDDQASLKAVRDRLKTMLSELRAEPLPVLLNEKAIQAQLDKINGLIKEEITEAFSDPAAVNVSYNVNRNSLSRAIALIETELDKIRATELKVQLNESDLKEKLARLQSELDKTPAELRIDYNDQDSLKAARDRLTSMLSEATTKSILKVNFNPEEIRAEIDKINKLIKDEVDKDVQVDLPVHTSGLQLVARELQFASRARRVPFFVVIDQKSVIVAEGILRSLAAINVLESAGRGLQNMITRFDTISIKSGVWGAAIGGLINSLFFLTQSLFTVGEGMVQVVGLAALAPTAFASAAATFLVLQAVFKDFGQAAHGIQKAMDLLPPSGQKAAKMFQTVFAEMRENLSKEFWGTASDAMLRFTETALPKFTQGLVKVSGKLGAVFAGILDSFTNMGASGGLDIMFNNLSTMFENMARGATHLWESFNLLGLRGSEFLPQFGIWLSDISEQFHNWLIESDKHGNITTWMVEGVNSLKDMFFATGALIDQFKAIAQAAGLIGPNGLDDFRRTMEHIARVMLAEPWQSQMASIFSGAEQGAHELADGVKDFFGAMKDAAFWTGQVLTLLGQLGGDSLSGFAKTISNLTFQQGLLDSLRGMNQMVRDMTPAFEKLGDIIGTLGTIAGIAFRNLAPVLNSLLGILDDALAKIEANVRGFVPTILTLANNILNFARGPISIIATVLDSFLGFLNGLPGPLKDATVAFGVFLLLRNQFGAFATALHNMWTKITTASLTGAAAIKKLSPEAVLGTNTTGVTTRLVTMADGTVREMNRFGRAVSGGVDTANTAITRFRADHIPARLSGVLPAVRSAVGAINTSLALIGGIPGVALGALGVLIATIGGNAASSAADVDRLKASLEKVTGNATLESLTIITENLSGIKEAGDAWANFMRGIVQNSKAPNETLDQLGINIGDVARIITGNSSQYDVFIDKLKALSKVDMGQLEEFMKSGGELPAFLKELPAAMKDFEKLPEMFGQLKNIEAPSIFKDIKPADLKRLEDLQKAAAAATSLNIGPERLQELGGSMATLTAKVEEQRKVWEITQIAQKIYADTLGLTSAKAQEVAAITQTLGDDSIEASGKIDAMRRSLDILNKRTPQNAEFIKMDQLEAGLENARSIRKAVEETGAALFKENGLLNSQSKAARSVFRILQEQADHVLIEAKTAFEIARKNGETVAEASLKALNIVNEGKNSIGQFAKEMGLPVDALNAQFDALFGKDWTLVATFTGRPDLFLAAAKIATDAGLEFDGQSFMAFLLAQDDPAKLTVNDVIAYFRDNYKDITFETTLDANPIPAEQVIQDVINQAKKFATDDYPAVLRAVNNTEPGVREALLKIAEITDPEWKAWLLAQLDRGSYNLVDSALATLALPRYATIFVTTTDLARDESLRRRDPNYSGSAKGSILDGSGRGIKGFNPKYFANGGIENHVAQITRAGGPVRVWAEAETQGEAYVPYAMSKRPRSVAILSQVAKDFGYQLTKATNNFANGGTSGVASPSHHNTASVHIGQLITTDPTEAVRKIRISQQDALAVAGITLNGA